MHILTGRQLPKWSGSMAAASVVAVVALLHLLVFRRLDFADDVYFASALDGRSLLEFLQFRYQRWTGRIPIELALVTVVNQVWIWKLANTAMFLLLCHSVARLGFGTFRFSGGAFALAALVVFLITPSVLWEACWWLTGSLNYLWPAALGAYALGVFLLEGTGFQAWRRVVAVLCGGLAAYNEQMAFMLFGVATPVLIVRHWQGQADKWQYLFVSFIVVNAGLALGAPGNANRYLAEQATWFANFEMLGMVDKLNIGLGLLVKAVFGNGNWLVMLAGTFAAGLIAKAPISGAGRVTLVAGLLLIVLLQFINAALPAHAMYHWPVLSPATAASPRVYLLMVVALYAIGCLVSGVMIAPIRRGGSSALLAGWALVAGMGSLVALGWSPTAFASGSRTAFVFMLVLAVLTCRLMEAVRSRYGFSVFLGATLLASAGAAVRILQLFVGGTG